MTETTAAEEKAEEIVKDVNETEELKAQQDKQADTAEVKAEAEVEEMKRKEKILLNMEMRRSFLVF